MPVAPRKPCRSPGCKELSHNSYCGKHERKKEDEVKVQRVKYDKERGTAASRGYTYRWSKVSKQYRLDHPLCVQCEKEGKLTVCECVDHIEAVSGPDDPKFWIESNWQSLCTPCHSRKTALEDGALGNKKIERFV